MAVTVQSKDLTENLLLAGLSERDRAAIGALLTPIHLDFKMVVYESLKPILKVYFPRTGLVSIVIEMQDGSIVEIATVGNEGVVGVQMLLGSRSIPGTAFAQIPGDGWQMDAGQFRQFANENDAFRERLQLYTQALFAMVAQSAACNRAHTNEQRCARWLLTTHDRMRDDSFPLTQEFLSQMMGVRRATVTEVAGALQDRGMIRYTRGRITVTDRKALEKTACECYGIIRSEFDRLVR